MLVFASLMSVVNGDEAQQKKKKKLKTQEKSKGHLMGYHTTRGKISYILQGEIEAFFPRGGCNSQGCVFPEPKAREIRIRGSWHPPRGKIFNFSQEFVILLPPNSAESQNFRGF